MLERKQPNYIYVVEMNRYGDLEAHHYILGAFTSLIKALAEGYQHGKFWRAEKYEPAVYLVDVDGNTKRRICENEDEAVHLLKELSPDSLKDPDEGSP